MNKHVGPYRDDARSAVRAALDEVNVSIFDYIECEYSEGFKLEPVDPEADAISVDLFYSTTREQYKATLRRVPASPNEMLGEEVT